VANDSPSAIDTPPKPNLFDSVHFIADCTAAALVLDTTITMSARNGNRQHFTPDGSENITPVGNQRRHSSFFGRKAPEETRSNGKPPRRLFGSRPRAQTATSAVQAPRRRSWFGRRRSNTEKPSSGTKSSRRLSAPLVGAYYDPAETPDAKPDLSALLAADKEALKEWSPSQLLSTPSETPVASKAPVANVRSRHTYSVFTFLSYTSNLRGACVFLLKQTDIANPVPFAIMETSDKASHKSAEVDHSAPTPAQTDCEPVKVETPEPASVQTAHGLLCPRCKVGMATIAELLVHQSGCSKLPQTPDVHTKFAMQREQFHRLFKESQSVNGKLQEANIAAAVAQDRAAQWQHVASDATQKASDNHSKLSTNFEDMRNECSQQVAQLRAEALHMNRLTQGLQDIQTSRARVQSEKQELKLALQEANLKFETENKRKDKLLQEQRQKSDILCSENASLKGKVQNLEAEVSALQSVKLMCRDLQLQVEENADAVMRARELQQRHQAHVAAAEEKEKYLENSLNEKNVALHNSLVAREVLAAELKAVNEDKAALGDQVQQLRLELDTLRRSKLVIDTEVCRSERRHHRSQSIPVRKTTSRYPFDEEQGRSFQEFDASISTLPARASAARCDEKSASEQVGYLAPYPPPNATFLTPRCCMFFDQCQGSASTPVVSSASNEKTNHSEVASVQRNMMMHALELSQQSRERQQRELTKLSEKLANIAEIRHHLAQGDSSINDLSPAQAQSTLMSRSSCRSSVLVCDTSESNLCLNARLAR